MEHNTKPPLWARVGWMIGKRIFYYSVMGPILGEVFSSLGDAVEVVSTISDGFDN